MNDTDSKTRFKGLVSATTLYFQSNSLTQIPSMDTMKSLEFITLAYNKITQVRPGDFMGADRLTMLSLAGNSIVSVAAEAFKNLAALRIRPEDFVEATNKDDGAPFTNAAGLGLWPSVERGFNG